MFVLESGVPLGMENLEKVGNLNLEFKALKRYGILPKFVFGSGNITLTVDK